MSIHPTAIVDRRAEIDPSADVGPYAIIDGPVHIGPDVRIYPHAFINGNTQIGARCQIHPGAVVGHLPQDLTFTGAETYCRIGEDTVIREAAQVHRGTDPGSSTIVGKRCFIMAAGHVGHNCHIEDEVKITNCALLAGHVHIGKGAFVSGGAGVHQFVRIGELAMISGLAKIVMDIPPYFLVEQTGKCAGVNTVGIRRAGFNRQQRDDVKRAFRILYRSGKTFREAVEVLAQEIRTDAGRRILEFVRAPSRRGIAGATVAISEE
ncbi:MAG: acyl-ACP--UDP-N-acetylglucosamine O-acyltransferase [Phycisphaerae bacterium]